MMQAFVFCCLIVVVLTAKNSCDYKGKTYWKGKHFMDECNMCTCEGNDKSTCTNIPCSFHHRIISKVKTACEFKGRIYRKGDFFKDGCNECSCNINYEVACIMKTCFSGQMSRSKADGGCDYKGKTYSNGENFKDECNTCSCQGNDMVMCTKKGCTFNPRISSEDLYLKPRKKIKFAAGNECNYKGKTYSNGENFMDECNTCSCQGNDMVMCTKKGCTFNPRISSEDLYAKSRNSIRFAAEEGCYYKGKMYSKGEKFKDECNTCTCRENALAMCTKMGCNFYPISEADKKCSFKGKAFKEDDVFMIDCNTCLCQPNGEVRCTELDCSPKQIFRG